MKYIKAILLTFIVCLFSDAALFSDEGELPKIGFVKNDGANVRAGDNINFETICKLKEGDPVKIIDKRYSWFKILLPRKAYLYIKNDFVDWDAEEKEATVNAQRVNLRAGPDTKYSIVGQVSKPEKLQVLSEEDGWYKIEPPRYTAGWIHSSQLVFTLDEIEAK